MSNKTKILFISTYAYPVFNEKCGATHGGSELQISTIAKELARDTKNHVSILVGDYSQDKKETISGVNLIKTLTPESGSSIVKKSFQAFMYFYYLIKENPDICMTSSANSTVGIVSFYTFLFRKKHIHRTAHIMDCNLDWINKNSALGKVYKYGLEHADQVISQTQDQRKALLKNHDIDPILFKNVFTFDAETKKKTDKTVLWVGRAAKFKQPELFIELAKKNKTLKFIMICNPQSDQDYNLKIENQASKVSNLTFIDKVPFSKIQSYFNNAKIFVSTSENEGFANTFIQAGIGKTPILSLSSNPDNFITKFSCGLHSENSFEKLQKNLKILFTDSKKYAFFSNNVFKYVKKNYDIKENILVLKKIIFDLLSK